MCSYPEELQVPLGHLLEFVIRNAVSDGLRQAFLVVGQEIVDLFVGKLSSAREG